MGLFDSLKLEKENLNKDISDLQKNKEKIALEIEQLADKKLKFSNDIIELSKQKAELDKQLASREDFFVNTELKYIDTLSGIEFENYFAELLNKIGYKAKATKASQDSGVDILGEFNNSTYVFQCKNYSSPVGNKAVQEIYSAQGIYKAENAVVITNNFYTAQAQKEASILNVSLWDREKLKLMLYYAYNFNLSHIDYNSTISTIDEYKEVYENETDPLLNEAIETVIETGQASTSFIQRKFKVGYARAGAIIDQMEERGIISGYQGSKPREVLITKEKWEEINS